MLAEQAVALGASWTHSVCEATRGEQRPIEGGFPGTIAEARWRVARYLGEELARLELSPLQPDERSDAVDLVYKRARRDWLESVRREKDLERAARARAMSGRTG